MNSLFTKVVPAILAAWIVISCTGCSESSSDSGSGSTRILQQVRILPSVLTRGVGDSFKFELVGDYSDDSTENLTESTNWSADDERVVTVDNAAHKGLVTFDAVGATTLRATYGRFSAQSALTVNDGTQTAVLERIRIEPSSISRDTGTSYQFEAIGEYSDGSTSAITTQVEWSSDDSAIASVNSTTQKGVVDFLLSGSTTLRAVLGQMSAQASVTTLGPSLQQISIQPSVLTREQGQSYQFELVGYFSDGSSSSLTMQADWSVDDSSIAIVDNATSKGLVAFDTVGSTILRASVNQFSAQATLTVNSTQAVLQQITIQPETMSRDAGVSYHFEAIGSYSDGSSSAITDQVTWSVDDTAIASVNNTNSKGQVDFLSVGSTTLRAQLGQLTGQASLTTMAPSLQEIRIQPAVLAREIGQTHQFELIGSYSDGSTGNLTYAANWSVDNTAIATVNNGNSKGLVAFVATGSTMLSASYNGFTAQSALTTLSNSSGTMPTLLRRSVENPRYFENAEGKEVLLVGSHTWLNGQDSGPTNPPAAFDYAAWLDFLEQYNHNFFRLWTWEQAAWTNNEPLKWYIDPPWYVRTGPGTALDGGLKFDLTQLNDEYFSRFRQRVIDAGNRGIYVAIMLFQGWGITVKEGYGVNDPWLGHPFHPSNNINGVNGDVNGDGRGTELHEVNGLNVWQREYVKKMIDTVNDLDNVLYEISNESHAGSTAWQYAMIDFIRNYEATQPKQHPIGMTVNWPSGLNSDLYASDADWISPNGSLDSPPVADGSKVIIADTDHLCGICGNRSWAWKSFTRGENPLFMDPYIDVYQSIDIPLNHPEFVSLRENLGYIRSYAQRMDLGQAVPCGTWATSQNCLGYKTTDTGEFLVYFEGTETVNLDLSGVNSDFRAEWFNPATGAIQTGDIVSGGSATQGFQAPWAGEAVLYLSSQ
jgi:hypothetical protein